MRSLLERFNEHLSCVERNSGLCLEDLYRIRAVEPIFVTDPTNESTLKEEDVIAK